MKTLICSDNTIWRFHVLISQHSICVMYFEWWFSFIIHVMGISILRVDANLQNGYLYCFCLRFTLPFDFHSSITTFLVEIFCCIAPLNYYVLNSIIWKSWRELSIIFNIQNVNWIFTVDVGIRISTVLVWVKTKLFYYLAIYLWCISKIKGIRIVL